METKSIKQWILDLCGLMSVSGSESYDENKLMELVRPFFDSVERDPVGNYLFLKKSRRENAPRLLLDTHYDEIGMMVREILEGGFVRITNIGGLDPRILPAAEVVLYGEKPVFGVIVSTPPHLQKPGESSKLQDVRDLLIDTGYTKETLEKVLPIGSPVGYMPRYTELEGGELAGKSMDNKACGACVIKALSETDPDELAADVYVLFSAKEESSSTAGANVGAYRADPDYAMCIDVNLGKTPDVSKDETVELGKGISLTYGPVVSRKLTDRTAELCRNAGLNVQPYIATRSTGTNTVKIVLGRAGIPTVDVGLPLKYMHTYNEVLVLKDAEDLCRLVREFVCDARIAEEFRRG